MENPKIETIDQLATYLRDRGIHLTIKPTDIGTWQLCGSESGVNNRELGYGYSLAEALAVAVEWTATHDSWRLPTRRTR